MNERPKLYCDNAEARKLLGKAIAGKGNAMIYSKDRLMLLLPAVALALPILLPLSDDFEVVDTREDADQWPKEFDDGPWLDGVLDGKPAKLEAHPDSDEDGAKARLVGGDPQVRFTWSENGEARHCFVDSKLYSQLAAIYERIEWAVIPGKETEGPPERVFILGLACDQTVAVVVPLYGKARQLTIGEWMQARDKAAQEAANKAADAYVNNSKG